MKHLMAGLVALVLASPAAAVEQTATFLFKLRGFNVGLVTLGSTVEAGHYSLGGVIENTGISRIFRQFSYTGQASGTIDKQALRPERYQERADTGRRSSEALMTYENGVPTLMRYTSPKAAGPDSPDPATQGGTVDPLTAIYALLRDVPRAAACQLDLYIFDGKRRSHIAMQPAGTTKDRLPRCTGRYSRLQGFTAKEVARHKTFDFVLTYRLADSGMLQVRDVRFDSFYGAAAIVRR